MTPKKRPSRRGKQGRRGHPQFEPTEEQRYQVEYMSGLGLSEQHIAAAIINPDTGAPINLRTLQERFKTELVRGMTKTVAKVVGAVYKTACVSDPKAVPAQRLFLEWSTKRMEKKLFEVQQTTTGVLLVEHIKDEEEWMREQEDLNRIRVNPIPDE